MNEQPRLNLIRLNAFVRFERTGSVTNFWGNTLRGAFGMTLRKLSCTIANANCHDCMLNSTCAYGYLFETPVPAGSDVMRKYPSAPHPFVLEPPSNSARVRAGDELSISFVVIGKGLRYLPYFYVSLRELGKIGIGAERVPFSLLRIETEDGQTVLQGSDSLKLSEPYPITFDLQAGESRQSRFTIHLETPARIMVESRICENPTPKDIVTQLVRRLFLLGYFHDGWAATPFGGHFIDVAEQCKVVSADYTKTSSVRQSGRNNATMSFDGVIGSALCEGDLGYLMPVFRVGEYIHVGKSAGFGMGKMRVEEK